MVVVSIKRAFNEIKDNLSMVVSQIAEENILSVLKLAPQADFEVIEGALSVSCISGVSISILESGYILLTDYRDKKEIFKKRMHFIEGNSFYTSNWKKVLATFVEERLVPALEDIDSRCV